MSLEVTAGMDANPGRLLSQVLLVEGDSSTEDDD